jgi:hypothetical protein
MPNTTTSFPRQLSDGNGLSGGPGTILGQSAADPIGFYGLTQGVVQPTPSGNTTIVTGGSTTEVFANTTFSGGSGTSAYTIGDIVKSLKSLGLLAE